MSEADIRVVARRRWALALIQRCASPPPTYGSAEWAALPEGSAEKVASVVIAAESWARDGDGLEERMRREVELMRAAFKADEDADYIARRDQHRRDWRPASTSFAPDPAIRADVEREFREWLDQGGAA